ncbi:hypothetical protein KCP74_10580 [Salmonella enterica subsp. enterica]|nr:hypothetical protein KCP74_10580 [Salmonella enterica subsp. enterica]
MLEGQPPPHRRKFSAACATATIRKHTQTDTGPRRWRQTSLNPAHTLADNHAGKRKDMDKGNCNEHTKRF